MTVDLNAATTLAVNITILVAAITAGVVWLKRWLRKQVAEPMRTLQTRTETRNGHTVGELAESTAATVDQIQDEVSALTKTTVENRIMLQDLGLRLDRHLTTGHGRSATDKIPPRRS